MVDAFKQFLQYLGGESDAVPRQFAWFSNPLGSSLLRGLWWGSLLILIFVFCGQSSKFIYIDF